MPQDNALDFLANPAVFINAHPIVLNYIAEDTGGGFNVVNNQRTRFTLSTRTVQGMPGPNDFPALRMQQAVGPAVVTLPSGGVLTTLDAMYCHASAGGTAFNMLPYCDIPIAPGPGNAHLMFTTGMNGCSLVVASAVPPPPPGAPLGAQPPLAPGQWRVMHDHDHRSLAAWAAAGYTLRFASYSDAAQPGAVPAAWPAPIVNTYNPHNYPWSVVPPPPSPARLRVVTNFLYWSGANWTFNSRHFHAAATVAYDIDAPAGGVPSTQSGIVF